MGAAVPAYTIRAATVDDAAELARLFVELGHPAAVDELVARWPAFTAAGNAALVAAAAEGLVGLATLHRMHVLHRPRPVGRITALVVDARFRGAGVGTALVAAAERQLAAAGCGLVEVTSNLTRGAAHAFYERLGYARTSYRFARPPGGP
ncbi:MAG: GNAT family N-acetyltransferase [Planctomycetes bacterium]|nr:GNAT family N-acetyltransferase [Planctomycetota bacterium]